MKALVGLLSMMALGALGDLLALKVTATNKPVTWVAFWPTAMLLI